jgi:hypothetical protein
MTTQLLNIFSPELLQSILLLPEVISAKSTLDTTSSNKVSFSIVLTNELRSVIQTQFGLDLSNIQTIPMRWIKGDTTPHVDSGASKFTNTYLAYLTNSPGSFVVDGASYPITANTGYKFNEGLSHKTQETGNEPRLLLGPMNEFAEPVGGTILTYYYPSEADALDNTNVLDYFGSYTIQSVSGYTYWRLASNSNGPSPKNVIYKVGDTLSGNNTMDFYYLYPSAPCFLEGTQILCQVDGKETYVPIEQLKPGSLVKTSLDGYKPIKYIGKGSLQNPGTDERIENRLYKCSPSKYPELKEDLYITGCHSILVDTLNEQERKETKEHLGDIFVTDRKYRLMACVDARAEPCCSEGSYTIWHFALEHEDIKMNYGVYANGLLVETCSINFMRNKSNLKLL